MTTRAPSKLTVALCYTALCLVWGSTWVVIKNGLDDLPPFQSAAARFVLAALALVALTPVLAKREGGARPPLRLAALQGTMNFALSYGIVYWAETVLASGLVSVLWAVFPLLMGVSGHYFLGERLGRLQILALAAGIAGVALLFETDLRSAGTEALGAGAILLLSPLVCVIGTTAVKRAGPSISATYLNRDGLVIGACLLVLAALFGEGDAAANWSAGAISSIVYLALAGTVLTFQLYFWLLRWVPAYKMSLIAFITPAIALFHGAIVRGESVRGSTLSGLALILAGCAGVLRRPRSTA